MENDIFTKLYQQELDINLKGSATEVMTRKKELFEDIKSNLKNIRFR